MPTMLDLFSGRGGASRAMLDRGWKVTTLDVAPELTPDICANMLTFNPPSWFGFDLVWASPPCDEFARESMPWCRTGQAPSLDLVNAALRAILGVYQVKPCWWVLENVRGSVRWLRPLLGEPMARSGSVTLWSNLPNLTLPKITGRKSKLAGNTQDQKRRRAEIPYPISQAVALAVEGVL